LKHATDADFETHPFGDKIDLAARIEGKNGPVAWHPINLATFDGIIDLRPLMNPHDDCCAYAYCEFDADQGPAQVKVGSDDGCAVWVNGEFKFAKNVDRGVHIDEDSIDVTLKAGKNTLLIKVNQGNGEFGFCARVVPGAGQAP
jgi:hypothetical protein